ncbi:TetR family transcriptional regulator [Paracoccus sp. KR1-242]
MIKLARCQLSSNSPSANASRGRRAGYSGTRETVLNAAKKRFAHDGYTATSIRKVAADAGVDPALVMQFYKSKDGLFAASLALSEDCLGHIAAAFDGPADRMGETLTYNFLRLWEEGADAEPLMATLRGAASNEVAAAQLREFVQARLLSVIGPKLGEGVGNAQRAGIVVSMLMGLVLSRSMVQIPLVAGISREELARSVGPSIQAVLWGRWDQ